MIRKSIQLTVLILLCFCMSSCVAAPTGSFIESTDDSNIISRSDPASTPSEITASSVPTEASSTNESKPDPTIEVTSKPTLTPTKEITPKPTPTVSPTSKPTPTNIPTVIPTPEIRNVWDKIERATLVKYDPVNSGFTGVFVDNPFKIGIGGTTAIVLKDASGNDAPFFIVKGGENGFNNDVYNLVQQAVEKCNEIDATLISEYFKDLDCVSGDINGQELTESRGFGATFCNFNFANTIFINGSENGGLLTQQPEFAVKRIVFYLVTEKCGLDYFNGASNGGRTIGVYKAEQAKVKFKELYDQGKINQADWDAYAWLCDINRQAAIDGGY